MHFAVWYVPQTTAQQEISEDVRMDALFIKTMESTIVLRSASSQTNGILPITVLIHFLLELKRQMRVTALRDD